ncbi:MAG: T9SS type A sorting domain-containing protein [Planctomycetota bacterium]|jgi:hypothetical protein
MNRLLIVLITASLVAVTAFAQPDTSWTQTFGGSEDENGYSVQETSDGGYILAGSTISFGAGNYDMCLIKTDAQGNLEWGRTYGYGDEEHCMAVQQTSDGGYILGGYTRWSLTVPPAAYVVKVDNMGNVEWEETYAGIEFWYCYAVQQTSDGGFILGGEGMVAGWVTDAYLVRLNPNGGMAWYQTYGALNSYECRSVKQTFDGGYILGGCKFETYAQMYIVKTNSAGDMEWETVIGGASGNEECYAIVQTADGGYAAAGNTDSWGAGGYDMYLVKLNPSGIMQWTQTFGGTEDDGCRSMQLTSDGGFILGGHTWSYGSGEDDMYAVRTDEMGYLEWETTVGGAAGEDCYSIQQTSGFGYILGGGTESFGAGEGDMYLVKLEWGSTWAMGIELDPYDPPIIISASGGNFAFNIEVFNNGPNPEPVDIWSMITLPGGTEYGPIINAPNMVLPPNWSGNRDRTQTIPANAPAGIYTYDGYVGVYPDTVYDEDHFEFEKTNVPQDGSPIQNWASWGTEFDELFKPTASTDPGEFRLVEVYPNPFNPVTTFRIELPVGSLVELKVFDLQGRAVREPPLQQWMPAGVHEVTFEGQGLASGVYLYRLKAGEISVSGKMVLMN